MLLLCLAGLAPAMSATDHRHGTGDLTITFQGPVLVLDMVLPAREILGFEHAPARDEDYTDIAQAEAAFLDPAQALSLPVAAGCAVDRSESAFVPLPPDAAAGGHADFVILYEMTCAAPQRLTGIAFPLFDLYPGLAALRVRLVVGDAHRDVTVPRDRPRLDLSR